MSWFYRNVLRQALFLQDSEEVHDRTLRMLSCLSRHPATLDMLEQCWRPQTLTSTLWGMAFPNPVGLAAGMDKQAAALPAWAALGFGFVELGGVTRHAQPGNPAPRMFRAVADQALINRMGFNNPGADAFAETLAQWHLRGLWPRHPVGVNLGKSKVTPLAEAAGDYLYSFRRVRDLADFFVVNVSSPNTPGLRELQDKAALDDILAALQEAQSGAALRKPILVKVAPDLTNEALDDILELTGPRGVDGLVATNTTITRPETAHPRCRAAYQETGGLSGRPLRPRSTEVIRHLYHQTHGRLPLIGVGGIFSADDAWEKITAGASLVQIYTGLVYEGPAVINDIVAGLKTKLRQAGLKRLGEAVGVASGMR